jgi:hypothetical protein
MTVYHPVLTVVAQKPQLIIPRLNYALGDPCWIHAGRTDRKGNPICSAGKVVYWFDLPDLAQRFYIIKLQDPDFLHLMVRDATVMSPTPDGNFPFQHTRHDGTADLPKTKTDWRDS